MLFFKNLTKAQIYCLRVLVLMHAHTHSSLKKTRKKNTHTKKPRNTVTTILDEQ